MTMKFDTETLSDLVLNFYSYTQKYQVCQRNRAME